jgi:hypothetical protein
MGDIREFFLATAILMVGLALSFLVVMKTPFLCDTHFLVKLVLVVGGAAGLFVGGVFAWAGILRLLKKRNR